MAIRKLSNSDESLQQARRCLGHQDRSRRSILFSFRSKDTKAYSQVRTLPLLRASFREFKDALAAVRCPTRYQLTLGKENLFAEDKSFPV